MDVFVKADSDDIKESLQTDSRGRVTLGKEYADMTVSVVVVSEDE